MTEMLFRDGFFVVDEIEMSDIIERRGSLWFVLYWVEKCVSRRVGWGGVAVMIVI